MLNMQDDIALVQHWRAPLVIPSIRKPERALVLAPLQ